MSRDPADRLLRREFSRLRAEEAAAAPDVSRLMSVQRPLRPAVSPRRVRLAFAAVAIVIVAVVGATWILSVGGPGRIVPPPIHASIGGWTAPTDVLLDAPGTMLLRGWPVDAGVDPAGVNDRGVRGYPIIDRRS